MQKMERKRTLTMNWDALGDDCDDDDRFFESYERFSSVVPIDLASSGSEEEDEFDDPRMSFASAISSISTTEFRNCSPAISPKAPDGISPNYDIWMAAPGSITERRKQLLKGMGLNSNKQLIKMVSSQGLLKRGVSNKNGFVNDEKKIPPNDGSIPPDSSSKNKDAEDSKQGPPSSHSSPVPVLLVRSRSDGDIESFSIDKKRKEELMGRVSKQRLTRTSSMIIVSHARIIPCQESHRVSPKGRERQGSVAHNRGLTSILSNCGFGAFFLIKNLDTGKEFIVNEYDQDGMWNRLSDLQTGKQLTMEEFEKTVGHSPVVKELMRRENVSRMDYIDEGNDRKISANSYLSKSLRMSKRRGAALLKNIKGVAYSMSMNGSRTLDSKQEQKLSKNASSSGWIKVRQTGKSYKDLSALHLCQEIQAHQGSIWTIRFSSDARFLASGGEDKIIHVWEVQECEVLSLDDGNLTQVHPSSSCSLTPSLGEIIPMSSERKKKWKGSSSRKCNPIPYYVHVPETVFSLSEKPVCSFTGHLDDVLDLSWSRSQLLLSSSMDKTVRLWDMETQSCLKLFAHNDYVTCIQFNPMDDDYFISGSLDAKVRVWNIPDRKLVDWTDLHEMVTAVCYTPDGQGAIVGSHKGGCRMYNAKDGKLEQTEYVDINHKKKSQAKKITGFQFSPANPSELLVTSADSRIRILDGSEVIQKLRGFRNINSQISASFSSDGKYVISASEDSHVYVWKREEPRGGTGKAKSVTLNRSHENFQCRDVSVAIPWNGTVKGDPPPVQVHSKRHSKRSSAPLQSPSASTSPTKEDAAVNSSKRHFAPSANASPTREENSSAINNKRQLPPLPKKNNNIDKALTTPEDDQRLISRSESGLDESFDSNSSSIRYGDSPSITAAAATPSSSWSSSWLWFDGGSQGNQTIQATAWGLVIVTASLGGEIRAYQNLGLPRRIGRQTNLF